MGHPQVMRRLDQAPVGRGQGELFALGDALEPGTGFQQLQAFAAEAFEFGVDRGGPLRAQLTPAHAQRHHTGDFHEQPMAHLNRCLSLTA
jgi:hypothetical protein